jgi:Mor family transcriptional regulator
MSAVIVIPEWAQDIPVEDLPEHYRPIIQLVGMENFLKLSAYANGSNLYFPTINSCIEPVRNRRIVEEYNAGRNLLELGRKYRLSERQVRHIITTSPDAHREDKNQMTLF